MLRLTTDGHNASRGLSATAELLVSSVQRFLDTVRVDIIHGTRTNISLYCVYFALQNESGQFLLPWNGLPTMPDLSEMVMRWLGDWPEDEVESVSSKHRRKKARQKSRNANTNTGATQRLEPVDGHPSSSVNSQAIASDNTKNASYRPSASSRRNRKKRRNGLMDDWNKNRGGSRSKF